MIKKLWLDFETSGLDDKLCGLTQIAFIIEEEGRILDMGSFNIRPFEGAKIEAAALTVTGKDYDQVMQFEDESIVLKMFLSILEKHIDKLNKDQNFTVAAYNGAFDIRFLSAWMERNNKNFFNYFNYHVMDPLALLRVARWEGKPVPKSLKLSTVYEAIFDEKFEAHDALADIQATMRVYNRIKKEYLCLNG